MKSLREYTCMVDSCSRRSLMEKRMLEGHMQRSSAVDMRKNQGRLSGHVPVELETRVKKHCDRVGISVTSFLILACTEKLEREGK